MVLAAKPLRVMLPVAEPHVVGLMDDDVMDGLGLRETVPSAVFWHPVALNVAVTE